MNEETKVGLEKGEKFLQELEKLSKAEGLPEFTVDDIAKKVGLDSHGFASVSAATAMGMERFSDEIGLHYLTELILAAIAVGILYERKCARERAVDTPSETAKASVA